MKKYKQYFGQREYLYSLIAAALMLGASLVLNYFAGVYATESASNAVTDIILNNIPIFDVSWVFVYGAIMFWIFIGLLCVKEPSKIPFTLKSIALFTVIRSVFISLTHIGPFPTNLIATSDLMAKFTFGGDLFFSGHTGLPFLMALVFWRHRILRVLFVSVSVFFGIIVLLGHLHYSIDVLSAFFITYSIFVIAERLFAKDQKLFDNGLEIKI